MTDAGLSDPRAHTSIYDTLWAPEARLLVSPEPNARLTHPLCSLNEWVGVGRTVKSMIVRLVRKFISSPKIQNFPKRFPSQVVKTEKSVFQQHPRISAVFYFYFCNHKGPWLTHSSLRTKLSILKLPTPRLRGPLWSSPQPTSLLPAPLRCPQRHMRETHSGRRDVMEPRAQFCFWHGLPGHYT